MVPGKEGLRTARRSPYSQRSRADVKRRKSNDEKRAKTGPFIIPEKEGDFLGKLTLKNKRFADEYVICGNVTQAYLAAYASQSEKSAYSNGKKLLEKYEVKEYIEERLEEIQSEKIADAKEVMEYLTSVMRGEAVSEEIVVEGCGDGFSEARPIDKHPSEKDRLKAAELLGKRYALYTDKVDIDANVPVVIMGYDDVPD